MNGRIKSLMMKNSKNNCVNLLLDMLKGVMKINDEKNKYDFEGQNLLDEVEELTRVSYDEYYNRFTLIKIISPFKSVL